MKNIELFHLVIGLFLFFFAEIFLKQYNLPNLNFSNDKKSKNETLKLNHVTMSDSNVITLFLCGDVMTGRGIDQILHNPSDPTLHELYVKDAREYVKIAEDKSGKIPRKAGFNYIWGDALSAFEKYAPDVKIINLETSITTSDNFWKRKGINYRMHPKNTACLSVANINCCVLANNHVLDWGYEGLTETMKTLRDHKIKFVGAGENSAEASRPAVIATEKKGRAIVYAFGMSSSGVPSDWGATGDRPGVNVLESLSSKKLQEISAEINALKQPGDILIASIHWGSNWGYSIPNQQKEIAHRLIDEAGFDIIHGHSSHHFQGIEIYKGKPILYGCGDFITDYEGIGGHDEYRGDLTFMYFLKMDLKNGDLLEMRMIPLQIKNFQLHFASKTDAKWMKETLVRECEKLGTEVVIADDEDLLLRWK